MTNTFVHPEVWRNRMLVGDFASQRASRREAKRTRRNFDIYISEARSLKPKGKGAWVDCIQRIS